MKIWRLCDPDDLRFAVASRIGTWSELPDGTEARVQPLIVEWEPDSDLVGDFTWPGFDDEIVVKESIGNALIAEFAGFELGPVEMVQSKHLRRPERPNKRTKPRVWLPYEGPPLCDLWVVPSIHIDRDRTTMRMENGRPVLTGMEWSTTYWDEKRKRGRRVRYKRRPGKGLFVREDEFRENMIFRTFEFPNWFLCTDLVKDFIEQHRFTNVGFKEMGETVR